MTTRRAKQSLFGNDDSTITLAPQAPEAPQTARQFVKGKVPMRRLMLELPAALHKRMKIKCAEDGVKMADVARELFEKRFPEGKRSA